MAKADEIARIVGYDSIPAFIAMLRRFADDADSLDRVVFLDAARVIDCLTTEVERLTDKDGQLADVTAWNVALSDAEVAALARGANPAQVRPGSIVDLGRIA